jgi:hypothetical protein
MAARSFALCNRLVDVLEATAMALCLHNTIRVRAVELTV